MRSEGYYLNQLKRSHWEMRAFTRKLARLVAAGMCSWDAVFKE